MHLLKFKKYYFIDNFNPIHLRALDKNISLIWRSKYKQGDLKLINKLADFCKKHKRRLFLSNNVKLALKLKLNGAYISAHNKDFRFNNYKLKKNFKSLSLGMSDDYIDAMHYKSTFFKIGTKIFGKRN